MPYHVAHHDYLVVQVRQPKITYVIVGWPDSGLKTHDAHVSIGRNRKVHIHLESPGFARAFIHALSGDSLSIDVLAHVQKELLISYHIHFLGRIANSHKPQMKVLLKVITRRVHEKQTTCSRIDWLIHKTHLTKRCNILI